MDINTIRKQVAEKGYASLTQAQKDVYNNVSTQPTSTTTPPLTFGTTPTTSGNYDTAAVQAAQQEAARQEAIRKKEEERRTWMQAGQAMQRSGSSNAIMQQWLNSVPAEFRNDAAQSMGISAPNSTINSVVDILTLANQNGYQINPETTPEDLAALDYNTFLAEAEKTIAPYYKQQFQTYKEDFQRIVDEALAKETRGEATIGREAEKTFETGQETLAGRGLAFSSAQRKFEPELEAEKQRSLEDQRRLAFETGGEASRTLERSLGTSAIGGISIPQLAGRSLFNWSGTPLLGTLQNEQTTAIRGKALDLQEAAERAQLLKKIGIG